MFYFSTYCANCFCEDGVQCFTFQLIVRIVFVYWMWRAGGVFYFSTYCANCFLFNEAGEQCFTFQLIVRIVFCLMKVVSSVLLFDLLFLLFLWRWCAVFFFSTYCFNCFCLMKVVCSVLLFNLLFLLFLRKWCAVFYFSTNCANCFCLFNGGGVQCFTFQLIVRIVFCLMVVSSVLLFNLLLQLFFV